MPWHGREKTPVPSSIFDYKHGFIFLRKDSVASTAAKANSPISSLIVHCPQRGMIQVLRLCEEDAKKPITGDFACGWRIVIFCLPQGM
jgi:hypothetical protein